MADIREVASGEDIERVADLAREIWTQHYVSIIGQGQVDYMLSRFQSAAAIEVQIADNYRYFIVTGDGGPVGYLAVVPCPEDNSMMLSKIYVKEDQRGAGLGRLAIEFTEGLCRDSGFTKLWLTVNRNNSTVAWYERRGFVNAGPVVKDIGGGYVMDDFKMEKTIV